MKNLFPTCYGVAAALLLASCGEDPELVKKHGEQQAEIASLKGELALINARVKNLPPDQSAELKKSVAATEELDAERMRLEEEVAVLEAKYKELIGKHEDYKRKYAIR